MANHLLVGTADKTEQLLQFTRYGFLWIDDGSHIEAIRERFPRAKVFDPTVHSFNPLRGIDEDGARDLADALYLADPGGDNTLTARNGKGVLAKFFATTTRLDRIDGNRKDPAQAEALGMLDRALFSPLMRQVLCNPTNFSFKGSVVAKIDRAALYRKDAMLLALLLIGQHKGQIVLSDARYLCPLHVSLIDQHRLTAAIRYLDELPLQLRQAVLTIEDKHFARLLPHDAEVLIGFTDNPSGNPKNLM